MTSKLFRAVLSIPFALRVSKYQIELATIRALNARLDEVMINIEWRSPLPYFTPLKMLPFKSTFVQFLVNLGWIFFEYN